MHTFNLFLALTLFTSFPTTPFASIAFGFGKAVPNVGVIGISGSTGDLSAAGTAAEGGQHVSSTAMTGPRPTEQQEELIAASPGADLDLLASLGGFLSRPVQQVPDYRQGPPASSTGPKVVWKRKVKKYHAAKSNKVCWTISKQCCYEEVHMGYKCRDYYEYKYARCHPVIDYEERCGEFVEMPQHHPKPDGRTKWEESIIKNYDANYGPHVQGYPAKGESEYYMTSDIPNRPNGVTGHPHPEPNTYSNQPAGGYTQSSYSDSGQTSPSTPAPTTSAPSTSEPWTSAPSTSAPSTSTQWTEAPSTSTPSTTAPATTTTSTSYTPPASSPTKEPQYTPSASSSPIEMTYTPAPSASSTTSSNSGGWQVTSGGSGYIKPSAVPNPTAVVITSDSDENGYKPQHGTTAPSASSYAKPTQTNGYTGTQSSTGPTGAGQSYRTAQRVEAQGSR